MHYFFLKIKALKKKKVKCIIMEDCIQIWLLLKYLWSHVW